MAKRKAQNSGSGNKIYKMTELVGASSESFADASRDPLWFDLFRERPQVVDGFVAVPEAPGLGLELREDTLEKYGVKLR